MIYRYSSRSGPRAPALALGLVLALGLAGSSGCGSTPAPVEETPSAEGYYGRALELLEGTRVGLFFRDVDYTRAIELFQEVIDNYPYSEYATLAELKIADIHFEQERFEEAASYYQDFIELHPNHPEVPYALFRNGMAAFEVMREPDQDQAPTRDAIAQFEVLLERYPDSEHSDEARERLAEARNLLALHDVKVADFYFERRNYHAAIGRYRRALEQFPEHAARLHTMARLGICLKRMQRFYEAERLFRQVLLGEPEDELLELVEDELADLASAYDFESGRSLRRSCVTDPNPACEEP